MIIVLQKSMHILFTDKALPTIRRKDHICVGGNVFIAVAYIYFFVIQILLFIA